MNGVWWSICFVVDVYPHNKTKTNLQLVHFLAVSGVRQYNSLDVEIKLAYHLKDNLFSFDFRNIEHSRVQEAGTAHKWKTSVNRLSVQHLS